MNYKESIQYLNRHTNLEKIGEAKPSQFGIDRILLLDKQLGYHSRKSKAIHIAGTKGKGSTAGLIAEGLRASGHRTGLYTSPHVTGLRERIQIDGVPIPPDAFAEHLTRIASGIPEGSPPEARPTFFEILTEIAFLHFAQARADWAVVETGLGGRLDATNILLPRVAVLTTIGLDHQEILGEGLAAIAREKAGILKPGVPAVSAPQPPEAASVIAGRAESLGCPLHLIGRETLEERGAKAPLFSISTPWRRWEGLSLAMPGLHQRVNAAVALTTLDLLDHAGEARLRPDAVAEAFSRLRLPGRIERLPGSPEVVADGAHNRDSIEALAATLADDPRRDRLVVVFACQKDKEAGWMLARLAPLCAGIVLTSTGNPRSADPDALARLVASGNRAVETADDPVSALAVARRLAGPDGLVCATGSLYLAGAVRRAILGDAGTD